MDSQAPLSRVELFIDNSDIGSAGYGGNRSDACNAIGNWPGCPYVGWNYVLDTTVYVDGPHMLRVTLTTTDNRQSSMVRPFIVNNNTSVSLDSLSLYRLTSVGTGKVVDVNQASISDGGTAIEESYHYGPNQLWSVIPTPSGSFVFESLNSGRALGIPFGSTGNTSTVVQYPYYGAAEQEWILGASGGGGYAFYNRATNKVLDIYGAANADGTPLDTFDYSIAQTQQWYLTPEPNPPSGLFGDGGSDGQSSVPQISEYDVLFSGYSAGTASSFAPNIANGPACDSVAELTSITTLLVPPDATGISNIRYNYTNQTSLLVRIPPAYIATPFGNAFNDWNGFTTTTFVNFVRQNTASADLHVVRSNNEQAGYCAKFVADGSSVKINYANTFISIARTNPSLAQQQADHEIGHVLGLNEAYPSPGTPTIMNQASGGNPEALCRNPQVPTKRPLPSDANTARTCISTARSQASAGNYGSDEIVYSGITYGGACTYYMITVDWYYADGSFAEEDQYPGSVLCP